MLFEIQIDNGDTFKNIPDKSTLLRLWSENAFHNIEKQYRVLEVDKNGNPLRVILDKIMETSDFKILEQLEEPDMCCSGGTCKIDFGGAE